MKKIYVRYQNQRDVHGYSIEYTPMYREYPEYGVCITRNNYNGYFIITDIKTGLGCGRSFKKLKDAKSFMEHIEEVNFQNWLETVERARKTERYKSLIIKVR